ncbi:hypothetical protein PsorP6_013391 [Peronosclerospora sorghi]|uniref:Uncharacterized protein n=1 Tax=Peronosclerospora sorghi TaxID=230839 RepID=A0ACC0WER7_9STRA|nr:hypothetical protein PsorP6_013391 [Peronosclerospora sorghi]
MKATSATKPTAGNLSSRASRVSVKRRSSVVSSADYPMTSKAAPGTSRTSSEASTDSVGRRIQQRSNYSVKKKRELIALAQVAGVREVCRTEGVPRRTLRHWLEDAEKINSFEGPDSRKSIGRSGRREILPFGRELIEFLENGRRQGQEMTSSHMISYIRQNHGRWLESYLVDKKSAESGQAALTRLCQRFVERHGFSQLGAGPTRTNATAATTKTTTMGAIDDDTLAFSSTGSNSTKDTNDLSKPVLRTTSYESECDPEDDSPLLFGLDIGTTAIKCVLVKADGGKTVAMANVPLSDVMVPTRVKEETVKNKVGVQNVDQVLLAVQQAVKMLPETARRQVASIGICGQMHGIVWWCSGAVHKAAERLLATGGSSIREENDNRDEPVWSELITWQDQRCTPSFLDRCREKIARIKAMNDIFSASRIAAGYGLASFAHTLVNSPRTLVGMDACGTIHDFVAFVLCGHTLPSEAFMDTTDAHSWGGLNLQTQTWDARVLRALRIPSSMLPAVKKPGSCVGHSCTGFSGFGLPDKKPVFVPMGDHPCSVLAALMQRQSVVNIGTSAQVAMILTGEDVVKLSSSTSESSSNHSVDPEYSSFEVRPFLFEDRFLGVVASLSGGNIFEWLVQQWQQWTEEMGLGTLESKKEIVQREAQVYARLIALGLQRQDTELTFVPTLNGERVDPNGSGSILNLRMNNWSMGDISAALSRGLVDNLFTMIPTELQSLVHVQPMIGTGNALVRNELLQRFLQRRLAESSQLQLQTAVDAAVGAALMPSLLSSSLIGLRS